MEFEYELQKTKYKKCINLPSYLFRKIVTILRKRKYQNYDTNHN